MYVERWKELEGLMMREKAIRIREMLAEGVLKSLNKDCVAKKDPFKCLFPQEFTSSIKTPIFLVNPAYDFWQHLLQIWITVLRNISYAKSPSHKQRLPNCSTNSADHVSKIQVSSSLASINQIHLAAAPLTDTRVQFHQDQTHLIAVHETQIAIYEAPKLECLKQDKWSSAYDVRTILISIQSLLGAFLDIMGKELKITKEDAIGLLKEMQENGQRIFWNS
ncbi:hypothetical protein POM88_008353 [Heracleum sosnowskyi]|uniref:Pectin acetylesterase n=1 Tax=Heracleum sosnowskyi TaxID=360622 RepID=A0AAD8N1M8_9APIA|nr:hypothetical protein POM88_008353 [Heracleum sosnowskyi]